MRDTHRRGVAIGVFDGVHLAHRAVLGEVALAVTFRQHPLSVLRPDAAPGLILSLDERLAAIGDCGVPAVEVLDFTPSFAAQSPEDFLSFLRTLLTRYGVEPLIRCGRNWRFGASGRGDADLAHHLGFAVETVPDVLVGGECVSSSRIRKALGEGAVDTAAELLGHPFTIVGTVSQGKGLGRALGYPTVNVLADEPSIPLRRGVYAVTVDRTRGLANWGLSPTAGADAWTRNVLEIHFLGTPPSFPEARVRTTFHRFVRPEQAFPSFDALRLQIARDIESIRTTP